MQQTNNDIALLGCLLNQQELIHTVRDMVTPDMLETPWAPSLLRAIYELSDAGVIVDEALLVRKGTEYKVDLDDYREILRQAYNSRANPGNVKHYATSVLDANKVLRLQQACEHTASIAGRGDIDETIQQHLAAVTEIGTGRERVQSLIELKPGHEDWLNGEVAAGGPGPTGVASFDNLVTVQRGYLFVVAARPKVGKTSWLVDTAYRWSKNGSAGLFFSLEMDPSRILRKLNQRAVPVVEYQKAMFGCDSPSPEAVCRKYVQGVYDLPLKVVGDEPTIEGICSIIRSEAASNPALRVVYIDYVNMIQNTRGITNEYEAINYALGRLVGLKNSLGVSIVLLAQLRRRNTEFGGGVPTMDEIKGSGLIEQSADVIGLLYEPVVTEAEKARMNEKWSRKRRLEIIQRDSYDGHVNYEYMMPVSRFEEWKHA